MNCKLTDANDRTKGGLQWGPGVTHSVDWGGKRCEAGCLHYYAHPLLAGFFDPAHANFGPDAHLWSCEPSGQMVTDGTKSGCETLTTIERIELPAWTTEQRVQLAVRLSLRVYSRPDYVRWANAWLDGSDRSATSESAWAAWAAESAARAAAESAWAARAAAESAWAAGSAWSAARAVEAAAGSAWSARSVARAVEAAAGSAWSARAEAASDFLRWFLADAEEARR